MHLQGVLIVLIQAVIENTLLQWIFDHAWGFWRKRRVSPPLLGGSILLLNSTVLGSFNKRWVQAGFVVVVIRLLLLHIPMCIWKALDTVSLKHFLHVVEWWNVCFRDVWLRPPNQLSGYFFLASLSLYPFPPSKVRQAARKEHSFFFVVAPCLRLPLHPIVLVTFRHQAKIFEFQQALN